MLTNWLYPAAEGNRSSMDDARGDTTDDDTQVMEADEGNGKFTLQLTVLQTQTQTESHADFRDSPVTHHLAAAARC